MDTTGDLLEQAKTVLTTNDQNGHHTIPASGLYPHQWLWDSCFISIGISHYDVQRAKTELLNLLQGQWNNGMVPHMIFSSGDGHRRDRNMWRSWTNPNAPDGLATTGITQPPMLAEAVVRIGKRLPLPERRLWYKQVFPHLVHHHQWLYAERDPHNEGLTVQIHPWETGFDDTPPWMYELHRHQLSWWIRAIDTLHLAKLVNLFRRDTHYVPPSQRLGTTEALALYSVQRRLRRKAYDIDAILSHSMFAIQDIGFNSIFIRANTLLREISKVAGLPLPHELREKMKQTELGLEILWDQETTQYYSRNLVTHHLIKIPTLATLLPLYAGTVSQERADQLVAHLTNKKEFGAPFPVPSTPLNSEWYHETGYWQGPTWINTNWLIADGLKRYGYDDLSETIRQSSLHLVENAGFYEYFSAKTGEPAGIPNFSWTAALIIDMLSHRPPHKPKTTQKD
jgi:hypothetical protein